MNDEIKLVADWADALTKTKTPFFNHAQRFGLTVAGPPVIGYKSGRWERGARGLRAVAWRLLRLETRLFGNMQIYESEGRHGIVDGAAQRLCDVGSVALRRAVRGVDSHAAALDKTPIYDPDWTPPPPPPPQAWGSTLNAAKARAMRELEEQTPRPDPYESALADQDARMRELFHAEKRRLLD